MTESQVKSCSSINNYFTEDPPTEKPFHRYLVLALLACVGMGSFFIYDNPTVLETQLESVIDT